MYCMRAFQRFADFHPLVLPFVYRFLPESRILVQQQKLARAVIEPEIRARRAARSEAQRSGKRYDSNDAISWFDDVTQGKPYDFPLAQLRLSAAAIHTTSSTLTLIMYDILRYPELIPALRKEVVSVLKEDRGWKKTSLYKMRLLDSVMKESIRIATPSPFAMRRYVHENITLFDGTKIPKGSYFMMSCVHLLDPSNFGENGDKFDGFRFLNLRQQPGQENRWQFVNTGPDNMRFGHGSRACPGR